jgi:hypothetical protein
MKSKWIALPLQMGRIGCPETSITNYQSTLRKIPEQRKFCENAFSDFRVVSGVRTEG